ncbi:MAG: response regulator [Bacteroidetes bacterium]|nr:response regulator [Bacteroidota bacterium]
MQNPLKILLVEDDIDDIELLEGALNDNSVVYEMEVLMEGDLVYPYLTNCSILPEIIILDFNLPKVHGRDILIQIKSRDNLKHIPVVVLTTSSAKEDMDFALENGASKFITKPTNINDLNKAIETILECSPV